MVAPLPLRSTQMARLARSTLRSCIEACRVAALASHSAASIHKQAGPDASVVGETARMLRSSEALARAAIAAISGMATMANTTQARQCPGKAAQAGEGPPAAQAPKARRCTNSKKKSRAAAGSISPTKNIQNIQTYTYYKQCHKNQHKLLIILKLVLLKSICFESFISFLIFGRFCFMFGVWCALYYTLLFLMRLSDSVSCSVYMNIC